MGLLRELPSEPATTWEKMDDNEAHHLKLVLLRTAVANQSDVYDHHAQRHQVQATAGTYLGYIERKFHKLVADSRLWRSTTSVSPRGSMILMPCVRARKEGQQRDGTRAGGHKAAQMKGASLLIR